MALRDKAWSPVGIHAIAAEFLRAERYRVADLPESRDPNILAADLALIDAPDLGNPLHNQRRWRLLYQLRGSMLAELPPDIAWHQVRNLTRAELPELHIIARCGWDDPKGGDRNELFPAARRHPKILRTPPSEWPALILFGHDKAGPFTIVEGNNRLAGYAVLENPPPFDMPVFVGLSPTPFYHHIFDPPHFVGDDLWRNMRNPVPFSRIDGLEP